MRLSRVAVGVGGLVVLAGVVVFATPPAEWPERIWVRETSGQGAAAGDWSDPRLEPAGAPARVQFAGSVNVDVCVRASPGWWERTVGPVRARFSTPEVELTRMFRGLARYRPGERQRAGDGVWIEYVRTGDTPAE